MTAVIGKCDAVFGPGSEPGSRQRRLEAFHPACRRFIRDLTSCAPQLEDLADSFPALLFALVSGYGTEAKRERAFAMVCDGAPLRDAADALGLAWWLRKLPAQAFAAPLPAFPDDPDFALRMANLIPRNERLACTWLARISHAYEAAGATYALWIARQRELVGPPEDVFLLMAAWVWFGERPGLVGHRLLRRRWMPEMSFKRAREELAVWRQRLRLIECLGSGIESPWLADATVSGFTFVALRTVDDFIAESEALENCLDQYADQLHSGLTAVFSIRKGMRRIACVEIGLHDEEVTMPTIVQLRAARNRRAPPEVWQATFSWLGGQRLEPLSPQRHALKPMKRIEARRALWNPYLEVLAGTAHERAFRRVVLQAARAGQDRRRIQPPRRATELRPALELLRSEPVLDVTPVRVPARDRV